MLAAEQLSRSRSGPRLSLQFVRKPFCLRPEREGMQPWLTVLRELGRERGDPDWCDAHFVPSLTSAGREVGVIFDFGGDVGNSLESLRLLMWAGVRGGDEMREKLAEELSVGHFEKRRCASDPAVQLAACAAVGIDVEAARAFLDSDALKRELRTHLETCGIHSIPHVVISAGGASAASQGALGVGGFASAMRAVLDRAG